MTATPRPALDQRNDGILPVPQRPLTVGFLSPHNPFDRRSFSGTVFHAAAALSGQAGITLRILGPHRAPRVTDRVLRRGPPTVDAATLDLGGLDAILGLVATPLLDALSRRTDLPLIHVTDATPQFLRAAYGWDIPASADAAEARVAARADAVVYTSRAMADRARGELSLAPGKAWVEPFGINFADLPGSCPSKPPLDRLELLFVGLDWARKGGDIAVAALDRLRAGGRDARLTVVGRAPEALCRHPGVRVAGYLDKNRRRDRARLAALYGQAHLFVLPTRGDCSPMVLAEAMAFGTPVLSTDTGGVAEIVGTGGAGTILPATAGDGDWADAIAVMAADRDRFAFHSDAAFERARGALSWEGWAAGMARLCRTVARDRALHAVA